MNFKVSLPMLALLLCCAVDLSAAADFGAACTASDPTVLKGDCAGVNMICTGSATKTCACKDDTVYHKDGAIDCIEKSSDLDATCTVGACIAANSECKASECKCKSTHYMAGAAAANMCTAKSKNLGVGCTVGGECIAANSKCESTCKCEDTHTQEGNDAGNKCIAKGTKVGGACKAADPKCMENAECKSDKCACKADFAENVAKTKCEKGAGVATQASVLTIIMAAMAVVYYSG